VQLGLEEAGEGKGKGDERVGEGEDGEDGVGDWNVVQNNGMPPSPPLSSPPCRQKSDPSSR